ncbi:hypothetical protein JCM21900_002131 [Sporobolomyces salmonicolor]
MRTAVLSLLAGLLVTAVDVDARSTSHRSRSLAHHELSLARRSSSCPDNASPIMAQYYPAWTGVQTPAQLEWNYADLAFWFCTVTTQNSIALPTGGTTAGLKAFVSTAKAQGKNPLMTLGGWSGSVYFSSLVSTSKSRAAFANTIKSWVTTYGFGGVDLDWEFPGRQGQGTNIVSPDDTANYLSFLAKLRDTLGTSLLITAAVPASGLTGASGTPITDVSSFANYLDYLTLMSYDYYGPWSSTTGPNSALYTCNAGSDSVDETVKRWVGWGFPACKLLVGTPGYSHRWKTDTASISTTTYNGQETTAFQSLSATTIEDDSWTVNQLISMRYLSQDLSTGLSGYVRYYDSCTQTPFLFSESDQIFVTYEDDASFAAKAAYAKANGLAGVAIYDSTGPTSSMFEAAAAGLGRSSSSSTTSPARSSTMISATPTTSVIRTTTTTSQSTTTTSRSTTTTSSSLAPTASSSTCSVTADCTNTIPQDAHRYCSSKICTFKCNTGYTLSNGACIKPSATSTTTAAAKTTTSAKVATTTTTSSKPAKTTTSSAKAAASSATSSSCSVTADCANVVPSNSHRYCASKVCSFRCNTGYTSTGSACVKSASSRLLRKRSHGAEELVLEAERAELPDGLGAVAETRADALGVEGMLARGVDEPSASSTVSDSLGDSIITQVPTPASLSSPNPGAKPARPPKAAKRPSTGTARKDDSGGTALAGAPELSSGANTDDASQQEIKDSAKGAVVPAAGDAAVVNGADPPTATAGSPATASTATTTDAVKIAASETPSVSDETGDSKGPSARTSAPSTSTSLPPKPSTSAAAPAATSSSAPTSRSVKKKRKGPFAFLFACIPCVSDPGHDDSAPSNAKLQKRPSTSARILEKETEKVKNTSSSSDNEKARLTPVEPESAITPPATEPLHNPDTPVSTPPPTSSPSQRGTVLSQEETEGVTSGAVVPPGQAAPLTAPPTPAPKSKRRKSGKRPASNGTEGIITSVPEPGAPRGGIILAGAGETDTSSAEGSEEDDDEDEEEEEEEEEDEEQGLIARGGVGIPIGEDGLPHPLLDELSPDMKGRKCLVLDLDETLVHSSFKMVHQADYVVPVEIENQFHNVYVIKRPGVDGFLKAMGEIYEVVIFTASLSKYADPVLDQLDVHRVVKHRLFRESCYNNKGNYVKDLSQLGRPMEECIIIDNSPASYVFHVNNAVPISSWFNDPHDTELTDLVPFLTDLGTVDDVRSVLDAGLYQHLAQQQQQAGTDDAFQQL